MSFLFLIGPLHLCGLISLYFFIREILQDVCNAKRVDKWTSLGTDEMVERLVAAGTVSLSLVVLDTAKSAVEMLDLAGREIALLSETTPVCMICEVTPLPTFYNTKFDGTIRSNDR